MNINIGLNKVFISSYSFFFNGIRTNNSGPVRPLLDFFSKEAKELIIIEQPLPGSDFLDVCLTSMSNGREIEKLRKNFLFYQTTKRRLDDNRTYASLKLRDFFSNFYFAFKKYQWLKQEKVDLFIGVESVNAIFGIIMRKLGFFKKVVYYIFDWAPDRYKNPLTNKIYLLLDRIATRYSDYTWNITYTIPEAKKKILNYDAKKMSPQFYLPYCVDYNEGYILPDEAIDPNLIIYSGGLIPENGPLLLLKAYKIVLNKFPNSRLLIIGGGGVESELREFIAKNALKDNVSITGYISDEKRIVELQQKGAIGIAPYPVIKGSRKPYGDVIKIRMYLACGLVVVSTPVPPASKEIEEEKLGCKTLNDSPEEIAKGIGRFLENKELLLQYRKNVIAKAKLSSWERNFSGTLHKMGFWA